jgi:hypothetical protein
LNWSGVPVVHIRPATFLDNPIFTWLATPSLRERNADADMTPQDWEDPATRSVALFIDGSTDPDLDAAGTSLVDDDFLVFVNA